MRYAGDTRHSETLARAGVIHSLEDESVVGGRDDVGGGTIDDIRKVSEDHEELVLQHVEPWCNRRLSGMVILC